MTERGQVKITIFTQSLYREFPGDGANKLDAAITWLIELREKIPADCRSSAEIEIDSEGGYEGEHHAEITIFYYRPETDDEMARRVADDRATAERRERRERETYEILKRKFEK